jgi:flagellin
LSSGLRINSASDDAARSAISSQLKAYARGLKAAEKNSQDGISLIQTAEGALGEVNGVLTRMRELAVEAAQEGTMDTTERGYIDQEFQLLESELDRIVAVTEYNGQKLINGAISAGITFQVGMRNSADDRIALSLADVDSTALSINDNTLATAQGANGGAQAAITALDSAIETIGTQRASLGTLQNRLTMTISNLGNMHEAHMSANSRLEDADIAEETASFTRNQILSQAGVSVLAQANQLPQSALSLLG